VRHECTRALPSCHNSRTVGETPGDLHHAAYLIRQKGKTLEGMAALASTFRFFFKYCSWGPHQLKKELSNTTVGAILEPPSPVWWTCATSSDWLHAATKPHGLGRPHHYIHTYDTYIHTYIHTYVHTYCVLIKPPMPYITSSPLCLLRVFTS
jgi:hypothetical protein